MQLRVVQYSRFFRWDTAQPLVVVSGKAYVRTERLREPYGCNAMTPYRYRWFTVAVDAAIIHRQLKFLYRWEQNDIVTAIAVDGAVTGTDSTQETMQSFRSSRCLPGSVIPAKNW
jgi:hypothetical protein